MVPGRQRRVRRLARSHGFADVGVTGIALEEDEARLLAWLKAGFPGEMGYMERHGTLRSALHAALKTRGVTCELLDYATPADPEQVRGRDVIVLPPAPLGISNGGLAEVLATPGVYRKRFRARRGRAT